jgi:hypothetical protein
MFPFLNVAQIDSTSALVEVNRQDMFPRHRRKIQFALDRSDISDLFLEVFVLIIGRWSAIRTLIL